MVVMVHAYSYPTVVVVSTREGCGVARSAVRLRQAVERYLVAMEEDGLARATIKSRRTVLDGLVQAVNGNPWMTQFKATDVRDYFRTQGHLSGQAYQLYKGHVNKFLKWAREEGYLAASPEELMRLAGNRKIVLREKLWLTEDQAQQLIDRQKYRRNRAFTVIALDTAARSSEMAHYRIGDLDLDRAVIVKTVTKSSTYEEKVDEIALTPQGEAELRLWLAEYATERGITLPELLAHTEWFLFPSHVPVARDGFFGPRTPKNRPTRPISAPWKIIGDELRQMGFPAEKVERAGVHVTRRTTGRLIRDKTKDIRVAQAILGHESQKTTEIYLGHTEDQARRNDVLRAGGWRSAPGPGGKVIPIRRDEETA
jgi:integrase